MSYSAEISRMNPGCFLILIDQSYSMNDTLGDGNGRKADELARAVNRLLQELVIKCSKEEGILKYFQIGIIGYGLRVGPALGGSLVGKELVWIDEIYQNPLRVEDITRKVPDGAGGLVETSFKMPIWFDPVADNGTPMRQAFDQAYKIIKNWVQGHATSYPPVVIHISDGESSDGDPSSLADDLRKLETDDGNVLLLNLHLSSDRSHPILFPDSETELPDQYAKLLFHMSSKLPVGLQEVAQQFGYKVTSNSRGFVFNAGLEDVIQFLSIGTRPSNLR